MLWLNKVVLDNTLLRWMIALGAVAGTLALARLVQRWLTPRLGARAVRTGSVLDECLANLLARTHPLALLALAIALGGQFLDLPFWGRYLDLLPAIALLLQLGAWGHWGVGLWINRQLLGRPGSNGQAASRAAVVGFLLRLVLWSLVLVMALDAMGFSVTTLVASLGIGGVAVALAAQNVLGDLLASLSITLDQPFVVGDFIILDQCIGKVESIGLKTTRIRSLSGERLILANSDLLKGRIRNFASMPERRVLFQFTLAPRTQPEQVGLLPATLRQIIEQQPQTRFDRAHLLEFSDLGLKFEVVYYVLDKDYNLYMDIQHGINVGMMLAFRKDGIAFAFLRSQGGPNE